MTDLSRLPQVDAVLRTDTVGPLVARHGREVVTDAIRETIDAARRSALDGAAVPDIEHIAGAVVASLAAQERAGTRRVINATGVVLHTNLGRAPLSDAAREAVVEAAGYCDLEYDLDEGRRGSRGAHVAELTARACEAEAAMAVNNGAAALALTLAALAAGREVLVSRGELVEIGGSFRLPDVLSAAGATLVEVGTTNRTRVADYRDALTPDTALLLKVHRSNYRVTGFTEEAALSELSELTQEADLPLLFDLGSGLLTERDDLAGLTDGEPTAATTLREGADLVVFSGDKLLGGPQAGLIAGRAGPVGRCAQHPLARAFRADKLQLAALEATLSSHLRGSARTDLPVWRMLTTAEEDLRRRAESIAEALGRGVTAVETRSVTGGGTLPDRDLPSWGLALPGRRPDRLDSALRRGAPPVVGRIEDDTLILDLRTIAPGEDGELTVAIRDALERDGG
jgi:L-seryl-tRNA(Ser) seleniumtransferase